MFRRLRPEGGNPLRVFIDDVPFEACAGDTVAAALLASGRRAFRTSMVSGQPRGPFCMMGACFECLVTIDGVSNRQACLVQIEAGMRIATGIIKEEPAQ